MAFGRLKMWPFVGKAAARVPEPAPGPSPWYLCCRGTQIRSDRGLLVWRSAGDHASRAGKSVLTTDTKEALRVLDFYWYVQPLAEDRVLLWRLHSTKGPVPGIPPPVIRFVILELSKLDTFSDVGAARETMTKNGAAMFLVGPTLSDCNVPAALEAGEHAVMFPETFRKVGELLVLSAPQADQLSLWIVDPNRGLISVFPQDWWNSADLDFGYQWITRVARDPATGRIVGEGIRIPPFVLDASCRQLAA